MIKNQKFHEAIQILSQELENHSKSRAALSLLGYCYFQVQSFDAASDCYGQLTQIHPEVDEYKLAYAQSLYKAFIHKIWIRGFTRGQEYGGAVSQLMILIQKQSRMFFFTSVSEIPDCNEYSWLSTDLSYNIALCFYSLKQYAPALKHIADIIERGIREHPELSVGMTTEGIEVRSVGNTKVLHETALIEAFNLKAGIEYQLKNFDSAQEALTDMPPRAEEELDPVTLHNQALMNMEANPTQGFEKLQFLLQQNPFPPETFGNLLLLYAKYQYFDLAADVLAENAHLTYKFLTPYMYDFLDAMITQQTSPEEAYRKLDDMATKQTETLRKLTKQVQEARQNHDDDTVKKAVNEYDEALERYIPVLMSQAKIYWDLDNYAQVEKIFRKSVEFCNEHEVWKLNVAHVLFMQENKYKEAVGFYEPIVKKHYDNILSVSAIVLANLCVSYIMTSANEEAEELMRKIEKEEEQVAYDDPDKKIYHLCIVNLVIGTLYCAKGNYEFGISRIMKSLEPYNKKLGTDTWFYAKRCFLSLLENMAKHMIMLRDSVIQDIIQFLEHCEGNRTNKPRFRSTEKNTSHDLLVCCKFQVHSFSIVPKIFLRRVLKLCEDNGSEISDELYEAYGDVLAK
ncbi:Tetratricopeptide repeat protein 30A [Desmophyllum pertusum]|uniref:Tetratricopeptide repeat protein 30 n=1 Tax=Desmophyllum pertusum TaxID=174260 RepID=A0A9X0D4H5_9CNID|nr:Tetratricopeptide repeat protein 30A [Desmophyllum pertusum]